MHSNDGSWGYKGDVETSGRQSGVVGRPRHNVVVSGQWLVVGGWWLPKFRLVFSGKLLLLEFRFEGDFVDLAIGEER